MVGHLYLLLFGSGAKGTKKRNDGSSGCGPSSDHSFAHPNHFPATADFVGNAEGEQVTNLF